MMKRKVLVIMMMVVLVLEVLSFWQSWKVLSYVILGSACLYFFVCAWKKSSSIKLPQTEKKSRLWLWILLVVGFIGEILISIHSFVNGKPISNTLKFMLVFACLVGGSIFIIGTIKLIKKKKNKKTEENEIKLEKEVKPKTEEKIARYTISPEKMNDYYKEFMNQ